MLALLSSLSIVSSEKSHHSEGYTGTEKEYWGLPPVGSVLRNPWRNYFQSWCMECTLHFAMVQINQSAFHIICRVRFTHRVFIHYTPGFFGAWNAPYIQFKSSHQDFMSYVGCVLRTKTLRSYSLLTREHLCPLFTIDHS